MKKNNYKRTMSIEQKAMLIMHILEALGTMFLIWVVISVFNIGFNNTPGLIQNQWSWNFFHVFF